MAPKTKMNYQVELRSLREDRAWVVYAKHEDEKIARDALKRIREDHPDWKFRLTARAVTEWLVLDA